ncbi:MAG: restriction endonuclease [Symploca sp. SIO2E6]|nr:restriction endonuclease [Symploca sp. SIO2E6]
MSIPDYQSIMLPLLCFASDEKEHSLREAIDALAKKFTLSQQERKELLPSGRQSTFDNRVGWARTYLTKAGLLQTTRRGYFRISQRGLKVRQSNLKKVDDNFLSQFPEFVEFKYPKRRLSEDTNELESNSASTPEEVLEIAIKRVNQNLVSELLQIIKTCSPAFFEKLVIDLLVKMGYGGTRQDAARQVGGSGDGGIDGIIKEDPLGLDVVYIQAKLWEYPVGRPEIQKFVGALQGVRARKGVFMTTSTFTREAQEYIRLIDSKIVLIDGETLAQFMIEHNVGVNPVASYEVKRIDSDYFTDE